MDLTEKYGGKSKKKKWKLRGSYRWHFNNSTEIKIADSGNPQDALKSKYRTGLAHHRDFSQEVRKNQRHRNDNKWDCGEMVLWLVACKRFNLVVDFHRWEVETVENPQCPLPIGSKLRKLFGWTGSAEWPINRWFKTKKNALKIDEGVD